MTLEGNEVTVNWKDVFSWNGQSLQYEVFVGTQEGIADVVKAYATMKTSLKATSEMFKPGVECSVVIHAVTPAGVFNTKRLLVKL